jgi:hypothetical protein
MTNGNTLRLRGLMLDAARLVEALDYYRRFLDFCAEWNVNAVIFRLADDQGCAMRFRSHPELRTHANALTPAEMAELAQYAAARGVDLIPEIESLGHSHYITQTPEHADLDDQGTVGPNWANALIPLHPKTLQLLGDLYAETAEIFPSRYLHAGCDETNWGGSEYSRQLLTRHSRPAIVGRHINALHEKIQALGREMIIWDDMVLQHEPDLLDHLDARIVLHDWEYAGADPEPVARRLALARAKGFRIIGGPALCWCQWGARVGLVQLGNIDAYADVYRAAAAADPGALGVIVTHWCPQRYIRDSCWDGLAYAAMAMSQGGAAARATAWRLFVERHFGATWNERWSEVFTALYETAPLRYGEPLERLPPPWSGAAELQAAVDAPAGRQRPFDKLVRQLDALQGAVRRNAADWAALRLSVAYMAHLQWRQAAVRGLAGDALKSALREVARRDAALAADLSADWRSGRAGDPQAGFEWAARLGFSKEDWLHGQFLHAAGAAS